MAKKKKKWISKAIKHPGAEKKAAKRAGMSTHAYMEEHKNDSGKAGKRARLGLELSGKSKKAKGGSWKSKRSKRGVRKLG